MTDRPLDVPAEDAAEQAREIVPEPPAPVPSPSAEVDPADAWEQQIEVPFDDDEPEAE